MFGLFLDQPDSCGKLGGKGDMDMDTPMNSISEEPNTISTNRVALIYGKEDRIF